jgi:hypothetical protein
MSTSRDRARSRQHAGQSSDTTESRSLLARFRERLATGSYDAVIGEGLRSTLRAAAADTSLAAEIGALRLTLVRLLNEEHDPSRLAAGVSRIAAVAVQAARLRGGPDGELDQIRTLLLRELDAVEKEFAHPYLKGTPDADC